MSKELARAKNLVNRRPIPPAIRELLEPLAAAAPENEKQDFEELYAIVNEQLPLPKKTRSKKDAGTLRTQPEESQKPNEQEKEEEE